MIIPVTNPFLQYKDNSKNINKAIQKVLYSNNYILGPNVKKFELEFAKYIGTNHAIGVASGTDAIEIALRSLGITYGDEILTVSHTAVGTVFAIEAIGAKPIFVDIDKNYFTIDPNKLNKAKTKKTKAVIVVHIYGQPADLSSIIKFCKKNKIYLIEDASQAHGAMYKGKKVGNIGDVGCFSCYPTKNLGAIGDAGIITTNKKILANKIRIISEYGWRKRNSFIYGKNSRLDELQASILLVKLKKLDENNKKRIRIAEYYLKNIINQNIKLPKIRRQSSSVFHLFVIKVNNRNKLINFLKKNNISTGIHYPIPIHKQPYFKSKYKIKKNLEITNKISNEILSLPIFPELKIKDVKYICKVINNIKL